MFLPVVATVVGVKRGWSKAVLYALVVAIVVSPYCIRNSINNSAFYPFDGKAALNLWLFNSSVHQGGFWTEDFEQSPEMPSLEGLTEKQRADLLEGIGKKWIVEHPGEFLRLSLMKAVRFLSPFHKRPRTTSINTFLLRMRCLFCWDFLWASKA